MSPALRALLGASLLMALASACSEESCPPIERCDIRDDGCQERAARVAACLRGDDPDQTFVPVQVLDAETYIAEQEREAQKPDRQFSPERAAFMRGLVLLGMADKVFSASADVRAHLEQVGAFYSSYDQAITVLDHGKAMDSNSAFALLVHEMVHALQDQENAFDSIRHATSWDMWLARRAVTEGDAEYVQMRAMAELEGVAEHEVDWYSWFRRFQGNMIEEARMSTDLFRDSRMLFPYAWGGLFVQQIHQQGGKSAVSALFGKDAPNDTLTLMDGAWGDVRGSSPQFAARAVPSMTEPWTLSSVSHLGAWLAQRFADRQGSSDLATFTADALSVFDGPNKSDVPSTAAWWRFELGSEESAVYLSETLRSAASEWADVVQMGREVWVGAHEPSIAQQAGVVAWSKAPQADLFFDDEEASAFVESLTQYGCSQHAGALPAIVLEH